LRAVSLLDRAARVAVAREPLADRGFVQRLDAKTEVVEVASLPAGRRAAGPAELSVDRHEVDERVAGAQLDQAEILLAPLDRASERIAIEMQHALQIDDAQHEMVEGEETEHGQRRTAGSGASAFLR
jgi:hypothetical protein